MSYALDMIKLRLGHDQIARTSPVLIVGFEILHNETCGLFTIKFKGEKRLLLINFYSDNVTQWPNTKPFVR